MSSSLQCVLRTFTLVMARSPGFGSTPSDLTPYSDSVSLRLPYSVNLATESNSLTHYTKGTAVAQIALCFHCLYTHGFRFYFTPLPGFFSPFPHGTCSLSVSWEYLALEGGPPIFRQDFTCPAYSLSSLSRFRVRDYHSLWLTFPGYSTNH